MEETVSSRASHKVWRLRCYSADGTLETCSIDWDRSDIRVDRTVASSDFFELTPEAATEFRAALDEAIKAVNEPERRWPILCCDSEGNLDICWIKTHQGALRIGCGDTDEPLWCFELGEKMIDQFRVAFDEALQSIETYRAKRDKETTTPDTNLVELWSPGKATPRTFALCEGIPPATIALGLSFEDCAKVVCSLRDEGLTFPSAENARQSLSTHGNVQLIWPDTLETNKTA
jgi:hypothetical protein